MHGGGGEVHVTEGQQPYHLSTLSSDLPPLPQYWFYTNIEGVGRAEVPREMSSLWRRPNENSGHVVCCFGHDTPRLIKIQQSCSTPVSLY